MKHRAGLDNGFPPASVARRCASLIIQRQGRFAAWKVSERFFTEIQAGFRPLRWLTRIFFEKEGHWRQASCKGRGLAMPGATLSGDRNV
jgi:hypothetical protein